MGSLATHFSAFLFLFPIGIRRLLSSFSLYLKSPHLFRSQPWHLSQPAWKNIDLYVLLIALPIAAFSEFFWFITFSGHPTYRFTFFLQSSVLFLLWVVIISVVLHVNFDFFAVQENLLFLFAGISFLIEYSITDQGYTGLAGRTYELLGALTLVSAASCIVLSIKPTAFFADVVLSMSLVFKGTWVLQAGLYLFSDAIAPKGCHKMPLLPVDGKSDLDCVLEEDRLRGVALIDLLFIVHAIMIFILNFLLFGVLSYKRNLRASGAGNLLTAEIESESMLMRSLPDFEIEISQV
ncbi:uncharacterized protein LOC131240525 [Magnolia sinica]|uniref:uncharacterized protein LOC131240525 n=1 Tax=Magnolia sinica TaxID=86752 RepID=UPI002659D94D|nr:uncharacterized protein LOC131240525 [Magnolia sinica]